MTPPRHIPVLPAAVLHWLDPQPGQVIVDCTVGAGGHSRLIAERVGPSGRSSALDQDPAMLAIWRKRKLIDLPVTLVHAAFDQIAEVLRDEGELRQSMRCWPTSVSAPINWTSPIARTQLPT